MKRLILTMATAVAIAGVQASVLVPKGSLSRERVTKGLTALRTVIHNEGRQSLPEPGVRFRAASDAGLWMNWGFAEGVYTAVPTNTGKWSGAIRLSEELATSWAGATITSVSVGNPVDVSSQRPDYDLMQYVYDNPVKEATVWVSESLEGEPLVSATGELGKLGFQWSTIELPEAVTIEAGKPLYIGYTLNVPADPQNPVAPYNTTYYCMMTDGIYPDADGCYIYSKLQGVNENGSLMFGDEYSWTNFGELAGNVCVRAGISGDMLPVNDVRPYEWVGPQYIKFGETAQFGVISQNHSATKVSKLEYTVEVQGMEPQKHEVKLESPIGYLEITEPIYFDIKSTTEGNNIPYRVYVSAINGESVDLTKYAIEGSFLCISEGYPRNVVAEEYTGTWCGWCVVGYAGMEYMAENYSDKGFIGIAVHSGNDAMDVTGAGMAYNKLSSVVSGFPSSYINRNMGSSIYPSPGELKNAFLSIVDVPAFAQITATLTKGDADNKLKLSTKSRFGNSEDNAGYMVAYTVIEDGVGPYVQTNYASGSSDDYYGFENKDAYVRLIFNDVARNCSKPEGVAGSLPANIEKDVDYAYDTEIVLDDEVDPTMVRVVAMVVNKINGAIENACVVEAPDYASVESVSASVEPSYSWGAKGEIRFRSGAPAADVYAADGRVVAHSHTGASLSAAPGIYVVSFGDKVEKVAVY